MSAKVTIKFVVPAGYQQGDYARLHGNSGSGEIDWDTPVLQEKFDLFPSGAGIFGWGHAPWGHSPWGHPFSMRTLGWGHLPWGKFPWGHGTAVITAEVDIFECGAYKFAFACYDSLGNIHEGTPEEVTLHIHIAPPVPTGLKKVSYNKDADVLILEAA